jgi:glycosyltransferase involved in cell wall biosynthesis
MIITRMVAGGAQKIVLDLIDGLPDERYQIHVISGLETGTEGSFWEELKARLPSEQIHPCKSLVRNPQPFKDIMALKALKRKLKRIRPDIVHTHTSKAGVLGRWAARSCGISKVIHSTHGLIYDPQAKIPGVGRGLGLKAFLWAERKAANCTDALVTLSEQETGDAIRLALAPPDRVVAISNGIPLQSFAAIERDPFNWKVPHLRLGIAGRLASEKGHDLLLRAIKRLTQKHPHISLKIAGDGPLKEKLKGLVQELQLEKEVIFCGYQRDMVSFLESIDIFILSSHYEGFGLVLVEAMAAGLPVVATDVGGVKEVIVDGKTGLAVPPGQEDELVMGIEYFINHPHLAFEYGQTGRIRAMEKFSRQQMIQNYQKLYDSARSSYSGRAMPQGYVPVDLHMHSHHSFDSKTKMANIIKAASDRGIRAISITDHDTLDGSLEALQVDHPEVIIVPGMEITSEVGDIIALFIQKPIHAVDLEGIVREVREQDGLLYLPHPFRGRRSIALELIKSMDIFEVYNGRSQGINYNDDAFGDAEIVQFAQEHGLSGMGGSDAHKPNELMRTLTYVPDFKNLDELKTILKSGEIFPIMVHGEWWRESIVASKFPELIPELTHEN